MTVFCSSGYDETAAIRDGWAIDLFGHVIAIDKTRFETDDEALAYLRERDAAGDSFAEAALLEASKRRLGGADYCKTSAA